MPAKRALFRAPLFSPKGYLLWAGAFALLFLICNLLGFREATSVLALTVPEGMTVDQASLYAGLYLISYLLFTLACPILALAAGIHAVLARVWS